jgi:hypothetical protein
MFSGHDRHASAVVLWGVFNCDPVWLNHVEEGSAEWDALPRVLGRPPRLETVGIFVLIPPGATVFLERKGGKITTQKEKKVAVNLSSKRDVASPCMLPE